MDVENDKDGNHFQESALPYEDRMNSGGNNIEILTRVELELPFASEKLLNLEMLVMEIAHRATDLEPITFDNESVSSETAENAFELDMLYGILDAEVKELDNLISSLQTDIKSIEHKVYEESGGKVKAKLDAAMVSLKQMRELIANIRNESAKFEKPIEFSHDKEGVRCESGHLSYQSDLQTDDQRRSVLHMLEQSIASELDLEKQLSDSRSVIENLKLKLNNHEQETYFLEESAETISSRMFAAENASELLLGTSKELINRLNTMQFHLNSLKCREDDLKVKLEQSLTKLSFLEVSRENMQEESDKVGGESPSLRDKVQELEKQLRESNSQLQLAKASTEASQEEQNALHSELSTLENIIKNLKDDISRAESRAQNAEIRCMQLTQANIELDGELTALKSQKSDKVSLLEKKFKESNTQLEHAKASVDAIVEQQSMLKSTMSDMEHMIDDLKGKVSKAETRAGNAESKCTLLTDTNLELSEELSFLRGRVECLENSLREANHVKMSTAKDIGIRTKIITDLVTKLALERERLHLQIAMLTKKNKILAQKCKETVKDSTQLSQKAISKHTELQSTEIAEEISPDFLSSQTEAEKQADQLNNDEGKTHIPAEDDSTSEDSLETVRAIEPRLLNQKSIAVAFIVFLLAAILVYVLLEGGSTA
ncbi:WPP domain-interacting tail-anchored protein 1-like isoform X2 [Phragmites australis]|uniref:WPP domain-interacting tail-anchored protein 1-like isoform X2 n=1 Tax=Phragmites australis TaxID=29695 RepID=UPI002D7780DD|nr:WPP domain-interacting tail-anchored protein 1-like isoform X2 [Phragmites australis]